jgi:hypothetical protein
MGADEFFRGRVSEHGIHAAIDATWPFIDEVAAYEDPFAQAMADRARFVLHRLQIGLKRADPLAIPLGPTGLSKTEGLVGQVRSEFAAYDMESGNNGNLERANIVLDDILAQVASFDKISSGKLSDAAAVMLSEMRAHSQSSLRELTHALEDTREKLSEAGRRSNEIQEEIDRKSQSFNSELQRFTQRYEEEAEQRRTAAKELLDKLEEEFSESAEEREEAAKGLVTRTSEGFATLTKALTQTSEELLKELESDRAQSRKILGLTAEAGLIGGYQREANTKKLEARVWRLVAFGVFAGMGVVAWQVLVPVATGDKILNWEALISRTLLFAILGLTAAYAANEGSRASRTEEKNRRQELQLASVGPFIEELNDQERHAIKKAFVERMYVPDDSPQALDETAKTAGTTFQLAAQLIKTLPDVLKAAK